MSSFWLFVVAAFYRELEWDELWIFQQPYRHGDVTEMCLVHVGVWGHGFWISYLGQKNGKVWILAVCALCSGANNQLKAGKEPIPLMLFVLRISSSHCHQYICRKLKTPLQIRSSTHTLDCHCCKNYLHRSIKSQWIRISTPFRKLVLDKRTDWTSQRWGKWFKKRGPGFLAHASLSCIHQLKTDTWNFVALGSLTNSENHLMLFCVSAGKWKSSRIKCFLSVLCYAKIARDLPNSFAGDSFSHLEYDLKGVKTWAQEGRSQAKPCLPITPVILKRLWSV